MSTVMSCRAGLGKGSKEREKCPSGDKGRNKHGLDAIALLLVFIKTAFYFSVKGGKEFNYLVNGRVVAIVRKKMLSLVLLQNQDIIFIRPFSEREINVHGF